MIPVKWMPPECFLVSILTSFPLAMYICMHISSLVTSLSCVLFYSLLPRVCHFCIFAPIHSSLDLSFHIRLSFSLSPSVHFFFFFFLFFLLPLQSHILPLHLVFRLPARYFFTLSRFSHSSPCNVCLSLFTCVIFFIITNTAPLCHRNK